MVFNNISFKEASIIKRKGTVNEAFSYSEVVNKNLNVNNLRQDSGFSHIPEGGNTNDFPSLDFIDRNASKAKQRKKRPFSPVRHPAHADKGPSTFSFPNGSMLEYAISNFPLGESDKIWISSLVSQLSQCLGCMSSDSLVDVNIRNSVIEATIISFLSSSNEDNKTF